MIEITELQWKKLMEGGYRQPDTSIYVQENIVDGDDCIREYKLNDVLIARMRVCGGNTDTPSIECDRVFEAEEQYVLATAEIPIPTEQDWAEFDEFDGDDEQWLRSRGFIV